MKLTMTDAWALYRLAYFPKISLERKLLVINEGGLSDSGKAVAGLITEIGDQSGDPAVIAIAERYLGSAFHERLRYA